MLILVVILLALIALLAMVAMISTSAASAQQAQAAIEAARAAQISAAGQSLATVTQSALVALLVVLIAAGLAAGVYFWIRANKPARRSSGKWAPGPNAGFRRLDQPMDYPRLADLPPELQAELLAAAEMQLKYRMQVSQSFGVPQRYWNLPRPGRDSDD